MVAANELPHRRSIRLPGYDYTRAGAYFVTLTVHNREERFGEVVRGNMQLSPAGRCADAAWQALDHHFPLTLGAWVVMPDHLHGIVILEGVELRCKEGEASGNRVDSNASGRSRMLAPLQPLSPNHPHGTVSGSLNAVIQNFKSTSSRRINSLCGTPGMAVWQRNYYEHIIRNEGEWELIDAYIRANPDQWVAEKTRSLRVDQPWAPIPPH